MISEMKNLIVLMTSINYIPVNSNPVYLPTLRALTILYEDTAGTIHSEVPFNFADKDFHFFTAMPSLSYFHFKSIPEVDILCGIHTVTSCTQLTHLYIDKVVGGKLIFPQDLYFYCINIENIYLNSDDFIMSDQLIDAFSRCQSLKVLALKILHADENKIATMFKSLLALQTFHLFSKVLFPEEEDFVSFELCLNTLAWAQQREVDIKIRGDTEEHLLNDIEEHQFQ